MCYHDGNWFGRGKRGSFVRSESNFYITATASNATEDLHGAENLQFFSNRVSLWNNLYAKHKRFRLYFNQIRKNT